MNDALFEQIMLIGEGKPYLSAMVVLNRAEWQKLAAVHGKSADETSAQDAGMKKALLNRVAAQMKAFPGYAQVRRIYATLEPWTVENGLITPTLKLRRNLIMEKFQSTVNEMYSGH
jgi:long-chain acyl-CoA synthetase